MFFYINDIIALLSKKNLPKLKSFKAALLNRFKMRSLGDLKWFLGIRVVRDRSARKLWLCQDSYIKKIATKFNLDVNSYYPRTPLPSRELLS